MITRSPRVRIALVRFVQRRRSIPPRGDSKWPSSKSDATPGVREFERLGRAITAARLQVPIAASCPLAEAAKAHERLATGHVLGKIVLRVRGRSRRND